jgi:light-regulated signal transduction histidine kinase (bacteriophytochrome)
MLKDHQQKLFEIFQRLHDKNDYEGIGLAHCQKIIDIHGGKIWVESKIREDSRFHFTIPIK